MHALKAQKKAHHYWTFIIVGIVFAILAFFIILSFAIWKLLPKKENLTEEEKHARNAEKE